MSTRHVVVGSATRSRAGSFPAEIVAAWAGIVGPLLFTAIFLGQDVLRRPGFDPVAEPVSALEAGPNGWVQRANFVVFGILTLVHALGLHRTLERARAGWVGPFLLGVSGLALLWAAVFPLRADANGATYDPGLHFAGGVLFFSTSALALLALSHRLAHGSGPSALARYAAVTGVVAFAGFLMLGLLVIPEDTPLHPWAGVAQRLLLLLVLLPCRVAIAERARRIVVPHA
jgi:hypothetical membrane protein